MRKTYALHTINAISQLLSERALVLIIKLGWTRDADTEIAQKTIVQAIDPAVNGDRLPLAPGMLDDSGMADVPHLLDHVQLTQPIGALG